MGMSTQKKGTIAVVLLAVIAAIAAAVYFIFFNNVSRENAVIAINTGSGQVFELNIHNKEYTSKTLVKLNDTLYGITTFDYDKQNNAVIYGTTEQDRGIMISASNAELNETKNWFKTSIAFDFLTDKIYNLDNYNGKLYVIDKQGQYPYELPLTLNNPKEIAVDPYRKVLFILHETEILKCSMDGSTNESFVSGKDLISMTVDYATGELVYASKEDIKSKSYVDSKVADHKMTSKEIESFVVINDRIYGSMRKPGDETNYLIRALWKKDQLEETVVSSSIEIQSVKVYKNGVEEDSKNSTTNPCAQENGGCEQLCLLSSKIEKGYSCQCRTGMHLQPDSNKCLKNEASTTTTITTSSTTTTTTTTPKP